MAKEGTMLIARNTVVTLNYSVRDTEGASIDEGTNPLVYLHGGYGGIFDRIEEELQGKAVGDELEVKLEPEDAFGEYDADLVAVESRQLFPENIEVGMQFERGAEDGESEDGLFTITDIADDKVAGIPILARKQLMVATAMVNEPDILLLDEPVGGLTPPEIEEFIELMLRLKGQGLTLIFIEHVMHFLMAVAGRAMIMHQGKIIYDGAPQGLISDKTVTEVYLGSAGIAVPA